MTVIRAAAGTGRGGEGHGAALFFVSVLDAAGAKSLAVIFAHLVFGVTPIFIILANMYW